MKSVMINEDTPHPIFFIGISALYSIISCSIIARLDSRKQCNILNLEKAPESVRVIIDPIILAIRLLDVEELRKLKESYCRSDLDVKSRMSWSKVMEQVYSSYGYSVNSDNIEPDHIAVELEFASILFREAGEALSRRDYHIFTQRLIDAHRFISTHLVPALTQCTVPLANDLKDIVVLTIESIRPLVIRLVTEGLKHRAGRGFEPS